MTTEVVSNLNNSMVLRANFDQNNLFPWFGSGSCNINMLFRRKKPDYAGRKGNIDLLFLLYL